MGKKKAIYIDAFKLNVILCADKNGNQAPAQQFNIDMKCVYT
jgi:hypothetical protein